MRYVVLLILYIANIVIGHILHSNLLSGNADMQGEYIGAVLLFPTIFPAIISGVICAIAKKRTSASFVRGGCWTLGVTLFSHTGTVLRSAPPWHYTFEDVGISVSVPNRHWKTNTTKTNNLTMLITDDSNATIYARPIPQTENTSDLTEEIIAHQQLMLVAQYNEDAFQFHDCEVKGYTCHYQDVLLKIDDDSKRVISFVLQNKKHAFLMNAYITPDFVNKYRDPAVKIILSAKSVEK